MPVTPAPSRYVQDILSQPDRLHAIARARPWQAAHGLLSGDFDRIVMTGMGASLFALQPAWQQLLRAGAPAWLIETGELLQTVDGLVTDQTLVIAASQSGFSAEVVSLTERRPASSTLVGLTNEPDSPLGERADVTIEIHSGQEHAVSTRSYVNTVGAAAGLVDVLTGGGDPTQDLHGAADALADYLRTWQEQVKAIAQTVGLPERLFVIGRGASLAAAGCGALILKEASKWPAEALSAGQFRHGPLELADDRLTAIILAGHTDEDRERNRQLALDLQRFGGHVVWADAPGNVPATLLPLASDRDGLARAVAEIVALQLVSVSIAQLSGVEPGVFRHLEKVTTVQ
jgi:glucosamine--fructose-6-phosphate aminotransferase (isomerizing)